MKQIKVELQAIYGTDNDVAASAWTSSLEHWQKKTRSQKDVKKLINFLAENQHSTPFESIIFKFWIKLPIQTDRQLMTHRIQSSSGMSGRYRTMPNEYLDMPDDIYEITSKIQYKDSIEILDKLGNSKGTSYSGGFDSIFENYTQSCENSNHNYSHVIELLKQAEKEGKITNKEYKRTREFFRGVLPQNNMTERVTIMNLRSWSNFYRLRSSKHAQPEIQHIANEMLRLIKESGKCKETIRALEQNGWKI